jgi:two-component system chemotaxis sensor kinase CheA
MDLSQFKQKFIEEAETLLTNLDNVLIQLEKSPADKQNINEAFRVMHTIKGAGGMYGLEKIVEITHELESLYDLVRDEKIILTPEFIDLTFAASDHIRAILSDEALAIAENHDRHQALLDKIGQIKNAMGITAGMAVNKPQKEEISKGFSTWNIIFYPNDELIKRAVNLVYTFEDLFSLGEYKIMSIPFDIDAVPFWSIFLVTDKTSDDIEGALMFIQDFCKIVRIAGFNLFDPQSMEEHMENVRNLGNQTPTGTLVQPQIQTESTPQPTKRKTSEITKELLKNINSGKDISAAISTKIATTRINVDAAKLDSLMYLVSELVTSKSELLLALQKRNEEKALLAAEKIDKLSKLFSDNALNIRLVSLQEMLGRFKRLVRDLAKQLGKNIDFVIVGEDTELDKTIIDAIGEPIMHLIRNNIDHGIEMPEERAEMGKSETGKVRFEALKTGNNVFITVSDDGKGIDPDYIYDKAVEKGFIQAGVQLSPKEILDLIFLPGFSTAQNLSDVSGRGVGMDIVQKKIKEIRGEISVSSEKGKGTTFTIKLQQTISIIDTLLIKSGKITYAIPVEDIEGCDLEARKNLIDRQNNLVEYDHVLIPFINLREKYSCVAFESEMEMETETETETERLIIINKQDKRYAIVADSILGENQSVIKPLGKTFKDINFISGASILGDGSIAILLDTDKLWYEIPV